jgi:molecular chaperone DnaJ
MAKNYYTILGVLPTATPEDIRGAYRRRAKQLHPDHYGENSSPFLEVQEAYGVLSDPAHRRDYDRSLRRPRFYTRPSHPSEIETLRPGGSRVEPLRGTGEPVNLGEISLHGFQTVRPSLEEIFDRFWGNIAPTAPHKAERLENLRLEILLTPEEAKRGGCMEIMLPSQSSCPTCSGQGAVGPYQCFRCMGNGSVSEDVPVILEFPPGISDGYQRAISLRHLGIRDVYVSVLFRIGRTADVEVL